MASITGQRTNIYCIEDVTFTIDRKMLYCDTSGYDYVEVSSTGNVRCSYEDQTHIKANRNPGTYTCTVHLRLYNGSSTYTDYYDLTLTILPSLSKYNLTTTKIGTAIGSSLHTVGGLETSGLINPYSPNKPNGSSPYSMGEWDHYSHTAQGGIILEGTNGLYLTDSNPTGTGYAYVHKSFLPKYGTFSGHRLNFKSGSTVVGTPSIDWVSSDYDSITLNTFNWDWSRRNTTDNYTVHLAYNNGSSYVEDSGYVNFSVQYASALYNFGASPLPTIWGPSYGGNEGCGFYATVGCTNESGSAITFTAEIDLFTSYGNPTYTYTSASIPNGSSGYIYFDEYFGQAIPGGSTFTLKITDPVSRTLYDHSGLGSES
jgi:hypothetical protein